MDDVHRQTRISRCCDKGWNDIASEGILSNTGRTRWWTGKIQMARDSGDSIFRRHRDERKRFSKDLSVERNGEREFRWTLSSQWRNKRWSICSNNSMDPPWSINKSPSEEKENLSTTQRVCRCCSERWIVEQVHLDVWLNSTTQVWWNSGHFDENGCQSFLFAVIDDKEDLSSEEFSISLFWQLAMESSRISDHCHCSSISFDVRSIEYLLRLINVWRNLFSEMRKRNVSCFANPRDIDEEKILSRDDEIKESDRKLSSRSSSDECWSMVGNLSWSMVMMPFFAISLSSSRTASSSRSIRSFLLS